MSELKQVVVFDNGSGRINAGYAGDDVPEYQGKANALLLDDLKKKKNKIK